MEWLHEHFYLSEYQSTDLENFYRRRTKLNDTSRRAKPI